MEAIIIILFVLLTILCSVVSVAVVLEGSDTLLKRDASVRVKVWGWFLMVTSGVGFAFALVFLVCAIIAAILNSGLISPEFMMINFVWVVVLAPALVGGVVMPTIFYRGMKRYNKKEVQV